MNGIFREIEKKVSNESDKVIVREKSEFLKNRRTKESSTVLVKTFFLTRKNI